MNYTSRIFILILFLTAVSAANGAPAETSLTQQIAHCAALGTDQKRLTCYDELARHVSANTGQSQRLELIQPPATFLDSNLVAEPWKAEYSLTVRSFVDLISHAVMEDKKHVTVQGWSRDKDDYVLHITMQTPVELHFLPRESARDAMSMSLLRDVKMDGYTLGADQFILTIAAMASDKKAE